MQYYNSFSSSHSIAFLGLYFRLIRNVCVMSYSLDQVYFFADYATSNLKKPVSGSLSKRLALP